MGSKCLLLGKIIMTEKNKFKIDIKFIDWWITWLEDEYKFCAIIEINNEMGYIERELSIT